VTLEDLGADRVGVAGARGLPATPYYKASLTYADGYRCTATLMIVGQEAAEKARYVAAAILKRTRRLFAEEHLADYRAVSVEVLGTEGMYGIHARHENTREVVLKIAVAHVEERALELFAREIFPSATSMAQGITGFAGGRPAVQPVVRLASCLVPKARVPVQVELYDAQGVARALPALAVADSPPPPPPPLRTLAPGPPDEGGDSPIPSEEVPLVRLAYGRSGDKGDTANISVLARRPEFMPLLARVLTPERVRAYLAHLVEGEVERYDWPGLGGWNFVLRGALGGGGVASLRYAQILMDFPVRVPRAWLEAGGLLSAGA
jgi:hypothetical protein